MRAVDSDTIDFLKAGEGILSITAMTIGNNNKWFADKSISEMFSTTFDGRILECSAIDSIIPLSRGGGGSGQVTVVLDNHDKYFDYNNLASYIYLPVTFAQHFYAIENGEFVAKGNPIILFIGQVSTPVKWEEKTRTIAFTITQVVKSKLAGCNVEDIGKVALSDVIRLLGQPLPMIFGHVYHSPCMKLTVEPTIWTLKGFGLIDRTLALQIAKLGEQLRQTIIIDWASFENPFDPATLENEMRAMNANLQMSPDQEQIKEQALRITEQQQKIRSDIEDLQRELNNQMKLAGYGSVPLALSQKLTSTLGRIKVRVDNLVFMANIPTDSLSGTMSRTTIPGPGETLHQWIAEGFKWIRAGSRVQIVSPYDVWYFASCTPGTVVQVWAYRSVGGSRVLTPVPTQWYSIRDLGVAKCVVLNMPLTSRDWLMEQQRIHFENLWGKYLPIHINQPFDWQDDLYIEYISDVGPKPIDIITWLVDTFNPELGSINIDGNGLADGKTRQALDGYSMNFMIQQKEDCLKLCQEIAYQCNSILYLRNNQLHLRYWPFAGSYDYEITLDDILYGSLSIETSNIDEIYTRAISTCRLDYSPNFQKPITFYQTHNVEKYGVITEQHDYFCYTTPAYVQNVSAYWLALYSDVHIRITFDAMPWHIAVESLDFVKTPYGSGVVYSAQYDSDRNVNHIVVDVYPNLGLGNLQTGIYWPAYQGIDPGDGGDPAGGEKLPIPEYSKIEYKYALPDGVQYATQESNYTPMPEDGFPLYVPDGPVPEFTPDVPPLSGPYRYNDYPPLSPPEYPNLIACPCVIVNKDQSETNSTLYTVTAYPKGTGEQGVNIKAKQLQIAEDDTIPPGSWGFVIGLRKKHSYEYYIQYPVWMG